MLCRLIKLVRLSSVMKEYTLRIGRRIALASALIGACVGCVRGVNDNGYKSVDFNNDGKPDSIHVMTSGFSGFQRNSIYIRLSAEKGSAERLTKLDLPSGLLEVDVKDINKDGNLDILYLAKAGTDEKPEYSLYVRHGRGDGTFSEERVLEKSDKILKLKTRFED